MRFADFDLKKSPLIHVTLRARPDNKKFEAYLQELEQLLQTTEEALTFIYDSRDLKHISFEQRIRQANWLKAQETLIRQKVRGVAYIAPTATLRLILRGVFLIQKPPVPYAVVESMEAAEAWAQQETLEIQDGAMALATKPYKRNDN